MASGNGTHHSNWDERREQLSAYLDGELNDAERKALEAHLVTCAECERELADLRQVRKLLRALPTPALPRSFTLPVTAPTPPRTVVAATHVAPSPARRESRLARTTQWVGGVAASLGLLLLLGSGVIALGSLHSGGASSSGFGPAGASTVQRDTNGTANTQAPTHSAGPGINIGAPRNATETPSASASGAPVSTGATTPAPGSGSGQPTVGPASGAPGGTRTPASTNTALASPDAVLGLTGAGLAGGGALIFVGGTIGRRRSRRRR